MRQTVVRFSLTPLLVVAALTSARAEDPAQQQRKAMDYYKRGEDRLKAEKFEEAAGEFQKAISIYPGFVLAHYGLGQSHMALKQYDDAVKAFSASRDAFYKLASMKVDDRMRALDTSQRMVDEYRNLTGVEGGGRTAKGIGERLNVLRDLEQVKRFDEGNPEPPAEISLALAGAWFRSGKLDDAEKENKNALRARPDYGQAHNNLAVIYMMGDRIPEAQAELAAAEKAGFKLNPKLKDEVERRAAAAR
jgi:tetratricopeptide (TPR) repeat protein